jgi:RNA polymerase sigma-70 factor, ECF subfamily
MKAAKWRALDSLRRAQNLAPKHEEITRDLEAHQQRLGEKMEQSFDQVIDDDILRLLFTACHPVLAIEGRIALTLRILGGLATPEIARVFLVPEKTMGQRITRAKKALTDANVRFETPRGKELHQRVESVLLVIYLIFNEGYTATSGEEWSRAALVEEALRLGRTLVKLIPAEPKAYALLALMEFNASRSAARRGANGEAVLLPDQDRTQWDHTQIQRGLAALEQAQRLGGSVESYALQAAITACHARVSKVEDTDWQSIVTLYESLLKIKPSPIVALNRAVAVGMAHGPAAGLDALDAIEGLSSYHLRPSVRGDLLMKLGRNIEAREELRRAISLTNNSREKQLLNEKLSRIESEDVPNGNA